MPNDLLIEKVSKILRLKFRRFRSIQSAYIYGSLLTDNFHQGSDIDILFIVEDVADKNNFLIKIKDVRSTIKDLKLDINVVFLSEFSHLWHIFRPPTFFIWIKQRNRLLWGIDSLSNLREEEITVYSIYKRAVDLAQGCRAVYLNDKDVAFWEVKYSRWLRELQYGILYLHGEIELDSKLCGQKVCRAFPEVKEAKLLTQQTLRISQLSAIAEELVRCVYNNFVEKK